MSLNTKPLFSYAGNKDKEWDEIDEVLPDLTQITTVVEPFGGSFSLTRHLYSEYPEIKFTVNDNDEQLISVYNTMKDPELNETVISELQQLEATITKKKYDEIKKKTDVTNSLFCRLYGGMHGQFPLKQKCINYEKVASFTDYGEINFTCEDGYEMIDQCCKDDPQLFLFLDPPYVGMCNRFYNNPLHYKLFDILKNARHWKCKLLLILDDNPLTETFCKHFGLNIAKVVPIKYQYSKINAHHIYVTNYLTSLELEQPSELDQSSEEEQSEELIAEF